MRIAYLSCDRGVSVSGSNGAATHIRELVNALVERGAEVKVLAARAATGGGAQALACEVIDVDTEAFLHRLRRGTARMEGAASAPRTRASEVHGLLLNQSVAEHLDALYARWPFDLIFERYSLWSYAGLRFARRRGLPFLLEVNAPLVAQQEEYRALFNGATAQALEELLLAGADRVIVPSGVLAAYVAERGGRPRRVRVIPCGVNRAIFFPTWRPIQARDGAHEFVVGFLGSLKQWHGVEILLEAFRQLRERSPAYRFITITGEVPLRDVPRWLERMDVGLAPYPPLPLFYFSPLKVLEYAASGVPFVASASGQIAEIFAHETSAMLHAPGNVAEVVEHVERLRASPELRMRLARAARRAVKKVYTWDRHAAHLLAIAETARRRYAGARR
ncbi:MAG: glycosyltransferase family 4 protein [Deltaproteobacteria bacterium]|nr:MAG: glycosyltransferase family 4 protein [Deltaproteobacteria bacterium]